jgi:murein DD-endopeptidase MepM/ murein hydrolase activator NlpD
VLAARSGTVIDHGNHVRYGRYVLLEHQNGYTTFYGHLQSISVELQDTVRSGSMIGRVGNTGLSTGPHLHFEIRMEGVPLDPVPHFPGLAR